MSKCSIQDRHKWKAQAVGQLLRDFHAVQILAEQHFQGLQRLVEGLPKKKRPTLALLTGDTKQSERKALSTALAEGTLQMLIGTHALLFEKEPFRNLGLAVIDEQHKYVVPPPGAHTHTQNHTNPKF